MTWEGSEDSWGGSLYHKNVSAWCSSSAWDPWVDGEKFTWVCESMHPYRGFVGDSSSADDTCCVLFIFLILWHDSCK